MWKWMAVAVAVGVVLGCGQRGSAPPMAAKVLGRLGGGEPARPLNVLLLGVDEEKLRTDIIILAHWEPGARSLNLVSLPRDSYVPIPCPPGNQYCLSPDKLGHSHAYGGPELAKAAVAEFLGAPIDHYVRVDFEGFRAIVDKLGGIVLDVDEEMADIGLKAGRQKLDGRQALAYIRYRSDGRGDIGRIRRTQHFLTTLARSVPVSRWPSVWSDLSPSVKTDLAPQVVLSVLGGLAEDRREIELSLVTLPGEPLWERNLWFWKLDEAAKADIVRRYVLEVPTPGVAAPARPWE